MALRNFFDIASQQKWYNNTLFVFVADHVSSEIYSEKAKSGAENSHIIYFMYTPDGSVKGRSDTVTQQIDIMPTTLGLLNYNKPYFAFGRDVFADKESGFAGVVKYVVCVVVDFNVDNLLSSCIFIKNMPFGIFSTLID